MPQAEELENIRPAQGAHRPYRVLAAALKERGLWALGRIVLSGHRYGVVLRSATEVLSAHLLHEPALVRLPANYAPQLRAETVPSEELQLAATLIDGARGPVDVQARSPRIGPARIDIP